jgi:hypothetical protein
MKWSAPVFEIKALEETGTIAGYGSVFGNRDAYNEVVVAGSFAKSLAEHRRKGTRPKMFWQHDTREPIGSWLDFSEDGKGLFMEGRLNMEVQRAREAHALLKAGDVEGLSIGYEVVKAEPDKDVLRLTELKLFEVSVVSLAANDRATVTAVKAEDIELRNRLAAGDRLTVREWERLLKEHLSLSNSEAERAVRLHLRGGSGDPSADDGIAFLRALAGITN